MTLGCYARPAGKPIEGGSHDITPFPTTLESRADPWRLQGACGSRSSGGTSSPRSHFSSCFCWVPP